MTDQREAAINAVAEFIYNAKVPKTAPEFKDSPEFVQYLHLEAAAELMKVVYSVAPIEPESEVLKMRISLLAEEVGEVKKVGGQEMREALLDLLAELKDGS